MREFIFQKPVILEIAIVLYPSLNFSLIKVV